MRLFSPEAPPPLRPLAANFELKGFLMFFVRSTLERDLDSHYTFLRLLWYTIRLSIPTRSDTLVHLHQSLDLCRHDYGLQSGTLERICFAL